VPLTTYPGRQLFPSFSPDGSQVAFAWNGPGQDNFDIYVKPNGTENLLRLTQDPAPDYAPTWSADGRYIAFLRDLRAGHVAVMMISSFGGPPERKLTEIRLVEDNPKLGEAPPGLSWSPDGKWIAMKDRAPGEAHQSLYLISVENGEKRRLTFPPPHCGDGSPAFSPDGRSLAFSRTFTLGVSEVYWQIRA
jgi:Tol biopolymer transport system component